MEVTLALEQVHLVLELGNDGVVRCHHRVTREQGVEIILVGVIHQCRGDRVGLTATTTSRDDAIPRSRLLEQGLVSAMVCHLLTHR